ncbi:MAG: chromosomal replication initiator protein DnaA [Planctomycetota bacterium]|nr:chromosomal replication initiator protein DnaA [Planctomycetota bacterium]
MTIAPDSSHEPQPNEPELGRKANAFFDTLKRKVSRQQYATWFQRTSVVSWARGELKVGVPNRFYQEWMQRHFLGIVAEAAGDVEHSPVRVAFCVVDQPAESGSAAPPPEQPAETVSEGPAPTTPPPVAPTTMASANDPAYQPTPFVGSGAQDIPLRLNDHYTFENFVMGPSNSVAYAAAMAVAQKPGRAYNPLFIHGAVGLGKTHLLHAICRDFLRRSPQDRICFLSCEEFTNEFVQALGRKDLQRFRDRFRTVNLLVIDDIHFLEGKERTQEEFFHTFNQLYRGNQQIVVSSDAAPSEIPTLEERLVSRFQWGLVTKLEQPEMETRMAIIRRKAELQHMAVPNDAVEYIADTIRNNIRELEGALLSVQAHARVTGERVTLALVKEALAGTLPGTRKVITLDDVVGMICEHYQVRIGDLRSKKRGRSVSEPRQVAMYLMRRVTKHSLDDVGGFFGGRDHSTVLYAVRKVQKRVDEDPAFSALMDRMADRLGGR